MSHAEDIPQPANGFYVLVTGANRYVTAHLIDAHAIDSYIVAWDWALELA
jgi:hypothetical protein